MFPPNCRPMYRYARDAQKAWQSAGLIEVSSVSAEPRSRAEGSMLSTKHPTYPTDGIESNRIELNRSEAVGRGIGKRERGRNRGRDRKEEKGTVAEKREEEQAKTLGMEKRKRGHHNAGVARRGERREERREENEENGRPQKHGNETKQREP